MRLIMALAVALVTSADAAAQKPNPLDGRWTVDLSTKSTPTYSKAMDLKLAADGTVTGSFYDSQIEAGRWKTDRGRTCVSFRTSDGAGPYHTAACARGVAIEGQTWAEHRNFLFNWNATRAK